jgi:tetratricopeptide (TPR) repeat protein
VTTVDTLAAPGARQRPARSRRTALTALAAIVVVGFSVGRFVLFEPNSGTEVSSVTRRASTPAEALTELERAVERSPEDVSALTALASAYISTAITVEDTSYFGRAGALLDRVDAIVPDLDRTLVARGVLALSRHQFALALEYGARVHERSPAQPDALAVLVDATVELGRYEEATAYVQELLDRRPGLPAYSRASYVRELHGDDIGAEIAMREAAVAGGGSLYERARVGAFLGDLALKRGDLVSAEEEYSRALERRPNLVFAEYGLARVHAARGQYDQAIEILAGTLDRSQLPAAITLLGDLQALTGRDAAAARSYELVRQAYRDAEASEEVTDLEVAIFEADHATDPAALALAVERARLAFAARPGSIHVADAMAWTLLRAGDAAGARRFVDLALRLGTSDATLHYHAAAVLDANGEGEAARAELTRAFAANPYFTYAQRDDARALADRLAVPVPEAWG